MSTQALRGNIEPLAILDVLAYVNRTNGSGILNVANGDIKKAIVVHQGTIVFARSNMKQDRMGDILRANGEISPEQYDQASALIRDKGYRHGRALIEIRAISPKILWKAIQDQVTTIAYSVVPWEVGTFEFIQKEIKQTESITLRLPLINFLIDATRNLRERYWFVDRYIEMDRVFQKCDFPRDLLLKLEPYEEFILKRIEGTLSLNHICRNGDLGAAESLRVIYLLESLGFIEDSGRRDTSKPADIHPLITKYNNLYAFICQYLKDNLGSIAPSLFRKYYEDVRLEHASVFESVSMDIEGRLDEGELQMNIDTVNASARDGMLEEALTELLYAGIMAVTKALGTEHETTVIEYIESYREASE